MDTTEEQPDESAITRQHARDLYTSLLNYAHHYCTYTEAKKRNAPPSQQSQSALNCYAVATSIAATYPEWDASNHAWERIARRWDKTLRAIETKSDDDFAGAPIDRAHLDAIAAEPTRQDNPGHTPGPSKGQRSHPSRSNKPTP